MAVTKIWQIKSGMSRLIEYARNPEKTRFSDLEQVVKYASDSDKTLDEDERFYAVTGINCNSETAAEEMREVQERFGKTGGNVAYHAYQSFKTGEVTPEQCHRLGIELAQKMWGDKYQVLVASHFNTQTLHNHFIIQPVSIWNGRKYDCNIREYYRMRRLSDEICEREGLTIIENPKKRAPRPIYIAEKNGEPTKYNLMREAIDTALSVSTDIRDFVFAMRKQGYYVSFDSNRKYATIRSYGQKRGTRLYRLGEQYDSEAIFDRIYENFDYDRVNTERRFDDMFGRFEEYRVYTHPPKKEYTKRREFYDWDLSRASVIEIYAVLFVLILELAIETVALAIELILGETVMPQVVLEAEIKPLSPELKEASVLAKRYSKQVILMSQEKFKTTGEIREYISAKELQIEEYKGYRERFRNKLRNAKDPKEIRKYREMRDNCTQVITALRQQKRVAQTILTDLPKVKETLKSEQNIQRENDPYEIANGYTIRDAKNEKDSITR